MTASKSTIASCLFFLFASPAVAADAPPAAPSGALANASCPSAFTPQSKESEGKVTIGGKRIAYRAVIGTLVVHAKDWVEGVPCPTEVAKMTGATLPAEAAMSYVAYFKQGNNIGVRPIVFLFNGGPGSSTVWLHMGAFGPQRVVTNDDSHTPPAPYRLVANDGSLLDAGDLVFIDAPGTGFGRIAGKDKEKAFWGIDADAHAFAAFIQAFVTKYQRWNSPKFLFGESYGTTRSAVLSNILQSDYNIDLNGIIMLSQILSFDLSTGGPEANPGNSMPYILALPTFAATAWYHHKLPNQNEDLAAVIGRAKAFAMGPYMAALAKGNKLGETEKQKIATELHGLTGLPVAYLLKANLRVSGGEFEKTLQGDSNTTTGRLDTRFSGPTMDPLSKDAQYDPQSAAISSAYVTAFNTYARQTLKYGGERPFYPGVDVFKHWSFKHKQPGMRFAFPGSPNVMPDLAAAMKYNPKLKILLTGGYFDLATPFFEGVYEMAHLPIQARLKGNISYRYYPSGHMIYAHTPSLKALHDDVAAFIEKTVAGNGKGS